MIFIRTQKNMKLRVVLWKPIPSEDQKTHVLFHEESGRIIGVPCPGIYPAPYTPVGGLQALEEILGPDGGFVEDTLLYGFPAVNIFDDVYVLDEFSLKPIRYLKCTCCGNGFRGRQWHNQDIGWSLGPCCVERCKRGISESEFIQTYGVDGYTFNVAE